MLKKIISAGLIAACLASAATGPVGAKSRARPAALPDTLRVETTGLAPVSAAHQPLQQVYNGVVYCRDGESGQYTLACVAAPSSAVTQHPRAKHHAARKHRWPVPHRAAVAGSRRPARKVHPACVVHAPSQKARHDRSRREVLRHCRQH
jgi:hypothetical protein